MCVAIFMHVKLICLHSASLSNNNGVFNGVGDWSAGVTTNKIRVYNCTIAVSENVLFLFLPKIDTNTTNVGFYK